MKAATLHRAARWSLGLLLLPALLYLLAANLFLRFGLPWAFKSTNTVNATVKTAWTVWPGVVHAHGVRIVFQDHNLQWSLDLDEARLKLRLRELFAMTFHATEVTGSGAVFRMRHRIDPGSKDAPWVRTLPPIPEYPAPAVFEARVPEAPVSDADYALWTVHLENVDVGVREIWAHFVRYHGDQGGARARGAFRLRPARTLWVGPASLTLDAGRLTLGNEELAHSFSGKIRCTVHPFDVRVPDGREVFRFISTELELSAVGATPDPALRLFSPDSPLSLDTEPGALRVSARVRRGKFSEDSWVGLASARVRAGYRDFRLDARQVVARAAGGAGERVESSLRFASAELSALTEPVQPARIDGAFAALSSSGLDAAGEARQLERRLELARVELPDARLLNALGGTVSVASGRIGFQLHADEREGTVRASSEAQLERLQLRQGQGRAELGGTLSASLSDARPSEGTGRLAVEAQFSRARFDASTGARGFSLREAGTLRVKSELRQDAQRKIRGHFQVKSSKLSLAKIEATSRHEMLRLTGLQLAGELNRGANGRLDGTIRAHSSETRALIGSTWLRARSTLRLTLARVDPSRESGHVASELAIHDLAAVTEGGSDCPWATLGSARIALDLGFTREDALATVNAKLTRAHFTWGDFQARGAADFSARLTTYDRSNEMGSVSFSTRATGVSLQSGANDRTGWDAQIPSLVLTGDLNGKKVMAGKLALSAPDAKARIGGTKLKTDFSALTALKSVDIARREARFSGMFSVSNARLTAGEEQIKGWWANISADSGLLVARDNVDLSLPFQAALRDAQPGLALLAAKGSLPSLIVDALPLRELAVTGTVQRKCRVTNFRFTQASGGPLLGRGLLNSTSDAVRGAFLVRLADLQAISAGVELGANAGGVSLLAGDDWLQERTRALDERVKQTLAQPCPTPPAECSGGGDAS